MVEKDLIKIVIRGIPVAQGRPRHAHRGNKSWAYDPAKSRAYKQLARIQAKEQYDGFPFASALKVKTITYRPIQKGLSRKERERRLSGEVRPTVKPDVDNYYKAVTDALKGIVWVDDAQIVDEHSQKWYSDDPRIELYIAPL